MPDSMKCKDRRIYVTPVRTDMQSLCTNISTLFIVDAKLQLTFTVHRNAHKFIRCHNCGARRILTGSSCFFVDNTFTEIQKSSETDRAKIHMRFKQHYNLDS
jgi:hypothetical protein